MSSPRRCAASWTAGGPDAQQVLAYDLAHAAAAAATARALLDYGAKGDVEARITCAFAADMAHDLVTRLAGREALWGVEPGGAGGGGLVPRHVPGPGVPRLARRPRPVLATSTPTWRWCRTRSARSPPTSSPHKPSTSTARNGDVPEDVIAGLAEIGAFGLSVPAEYGGYSEGGDREYLAMVVATEELSRASLGIGGSLITRPEILTRALVKGGTEDQKLHWLPKLATAEVMAAVAVTEPDYGSDVAGLKVTATPGRRPRRRPGLRHQRGQDVVHVRGACRRADAAGPHRSRPFEVAPRAEPVHRAQAPRRRPRLRVRPGRRRRRRRPGRQDGGTPDRHHRLPRACTATRWRSRTGGSRRPPDRRSRRARARLLPPDGGVRERPPADRRPGRRGDAGRLRSGARLRPQPQRVRLATSSTTSSPGPSWVGWRC